MTPAAVASSVVGWTYFTAWTVSFYPQAIMNYRRKSVDGLAVEFLYLNVGAFLCLSIYNIALYTSAGVRNEYAGRHDGAMPAVAVNDVAFAVHAFLISSFTLLQTFIYPRGPEQYLSKRFQSLLVTLLAVIATTFVGALTRWLSMLDFIYFLSYIKLFASFIKYLPQLFLNIRRQSTLGWSIANILLDFTGGSLSIVQLLIDSFTATDRPWDGVKGNLPKFGLGALSIAFDVAFILQHFVFYGPTEPYKAERRMLDEEDPLLS